MDYRVLLIAPLAAAAVAASGADAMRPAAGWHSIAPSNEYVSGVDPRLDEGGRHTLTVKSLGQRTASNFSVAEQFVLGYAGQRVRFSGQVKAAGVDAWAGLMMGRGIYPMNHMMQNDANAPSYRPLGIAACPQWCDVSVVMDVPADEPWLDVGVALVGNGQIWARALKLEVVGSDVPLSGQPVGPDPLTARAERLRQARERAAQPTPPRNLALQ